ncbi:rod shape-determining protein MreD [Mangrovicoccus algicola]|uniref:Rod shape-determining protein MreD n=1 Tax=Mangrovicoccus algicola TaxID=2771008 RepID=A0A8J6YWG5_9RHOB|nr:rod shape-determining protein MreD [Mangrovicoccus algicola]MBE3639160.1 rod shape-determining protein MreD [Mangrovicoccus algicola]
MARSRGAGLWLARAAYAAIALAAMAVLLMPLWIEPGGWPGPDLLSALTLAWVLRRPEQVPVLLIAGVMLTADLMLQRPPGLWAALMVAGSEVLRARRRTGRPLGVVAEWALAGTVIFAMSLADWLAMTVTLARHAPLADMLAATAVTILSYPLTALGLRLAGVRRLDYPQGVIRRTRT